MILHEVMISYITVNFHCPDTEAGKRRVKITMREKAKDLTKACSASINGVKTAVEVSQGVKIKSILLSGH